MIVVSTLAMLIAIVIISAIVSCTLGLNSGDEGMVYDWRTETMVFKPTRYDIMLEIIIKS